MKRITIILGFCVLLTLPVMAATRVSGTSGTTASTRQGATNQRIRTQNVVNRGTVRTISKQQVSARTTSTKSGNIIQRNTKTDSGRTMVAARAATNDASTTRIGAAYEQCKGAFFSCMDQFCQLKNDDYRRCSCSDRITDLESARNKLQQAGEQLTAFNENLDIVGKTAAQATAMNTASEGELALTKDSSKSKALLNAIMDTIRGTSTPVEHSQLSDLNSIDLSFDATNSFGNETSGQIIASYNGQALYSAVYPQCRNAVRDQCNDASLQRAVNAYLMAIEQDCNTVQTAINQKQKATHNAIRESSSLLDMARAENHKNHNSDDIATCIANVETAILSEEVCGKNYHKCLDNGEYIDVATGAPIAGIVDFYKLGKMLSFSTGRNNADQKLAQNPNNRTFVTNFEKRVKQFAEPALDKCLDDADTVWTDYLNKALLDIYYAQQDKVSEIQQGCFDFVSACYMNGSTAMTNAMQGLVAAQTTPLNPNIGVLNKDLCNDYIASCNNMFDGNIIEAYISNRHDTDSLAACRAVIQQCFDSYGGQNYENFYSPSSGLFAPGEAPKWFSLYEVDTDGKYKCKSGTSQDPSDTDQCKSNGGYAYVSECAQQIAAIEACSSKDIIEQAFGGLDYYGDNTTIYQRYATNVSGIGLKARILRPAGIATEVYNQIVDTLQSQCTTSMDGKFMTVQNLEFFSADYNPSAFCEAIFALKENADANTSRYYNYTFDYSRPYSKGPNTYNVFGLPIRTTQNAALYPSEQACRAAGGAYGEVTTSSTSNTGSSSTGTGNFTGNINAGMTIDNFTLYPIDIRRGCVTVNVPEDMCPANYKNNVDVQSWGACLCWENGGRRSNNGTSTRCVPTFPVRPLTHYKKLQGITADDSGRTAESATFQQVLEQPGLGNSCVGYYKSKPTQNSDGTYPNPSDTFDLWGRANTVSDLPTSNDWCTGIVDKYNRVCPFGVTKLDSDKLCDISSAYENPINGYNASGAQYTPDTNIYCIKRWDGVNLFYNQADNTCYYCENTISSANDLNNTNCSGYAKAFTDGAIMANVPCGNGVKCD